MVADPSCSVVCIREIQKSLEFSAKRLVETKIRALGVASLFDITKTEIRRRGGTGIMIFQGMQDHTADSIKSLEGFRIAWVEEAQSLSARSLELLRPTIRAEGSEIWFSWNPYLPSDPVDEFFASGRPDAVLVRVNWNDNPFLPDTLRQEMENDLEQAKRTGDMATFRHVWEGAYRDVVEGAIYKAEMEQARIQGRIGRVPYDPDMPVDTFWDLGVNDPTAIIFAQAAPDGYRVIDYYEASDGSLAHFARVLADKGYDYGTHYGPHDLQVRELGSGRTRIESAAALGIYFEVAPNVAVDDGIHAAKMLWPQVWIDEANCRPLLDALGNYRREVNARLSTGGHVVFKPAPVHDWASHGADAFRYMALAIQKPKAEVPRRIRSSRPRSWMN